MNSKYELLFSIQDVNILSKFYRVFSEIAGLGITQNCHVHKIYWQIVAKLLKGLTRLACTMKAQGIRDEAFKIVEK